MLSVDLSPTNELFNLLMSGLEGDHDVGKTFCNYINMCFKRRSEILSQNKERDILQRVVATTTRSGRLSKRPTILDLWYRFYFSKLVIYLSHYFTFSMVYIYMLHHLYSTAWFLQFHHIGFTSVYFFMYILIAVLCCVCMCACSM